MSNINICVACDDNYAKYAGVVITSILSNSEDSTNLYFYILDGGISKEHQNEILSLKNIKNCSINFVKINEEDFQEYQKVCTHKYITIATYYRLKLASLLPNIHRVIYLDCDTVVNCDLTELFNIPLTTEVFAGSHDIDKKTVEVNPTYVNAGVLVIDLDNMRQGRLEEKFLKYTQENFETIKCGDQTIINEVCKGNIKVVDDSWNVQTSDFMNRSCFIRKPNIIHYIAKNKPWKDISLCYFKNYYIKYLQLTPWKKNKLESIRYKYINQVLSLFKFIIHRPTFLFQGKFYEALLKSYIVKRS